MRIFSMLFAALILTATFNTSALAARECFYGRSADFFDVTGPETIVVRQGGRRYELTMKYCHGLRWANRIAFDSHSSWVCQGDWVYLLDFMNRVEDRCRIDQLVRIR